MSFSFSDICAHNLLYLFAVSFLRFIISLTTCYIILPFLLKPSELCAAGFYCVSGMDRAEPDGSNSTANATDGWCYDGKQTGYGGRCFEGHYCPEGTDYPIACAAGTYQSEIGKGTCNTCVAGK